MATVEELSKLKVTELKAELSKRGLKTAGLKKELVERLVGAIASEKAEEEVPPNAPEPPKEVEATGGEAGTLAVGSEEIVAEGPVAPEQKKEALIEDVDESNEAVTGLDSGQEKAADDKNEDAAREKGAELNDVQAAAEKLPTPTAEFDVAPSENTDAMKKAPSQNLSDSLEPTKKDEDLVANKSLADRLTDEAPIERPSLPAPNESSSQPSYAGFKRKFEIDQTREPVASSDKKPRQEDEMVSAEETASKCVHPPTNALYIRNFTRPLNLPNLKREIKSNCSGSIGTFWMDTIKSHCFITLDSIADGTKVFNAFDGKTWPFEEKSRRQLTVGFVNADCIPDWIAKEESGSIDQRWEVIYIKHGDNDVSADFQLARNLNTQHIPVIGGNFQESVRPTESRSNKMSAPSNTVAAEKSSKYSFDAFLITHSQGAPVSNAISPEELFRKTQATPVLFFKTAES